jgi:2'-5' RNA ligase
VRSDTRTIGVALTVPEPWGDELQEQRAAYGDRLAWTIPTHITLLPPTQVPRERLPQIDEHLAEIASYSARFELQLGPAATFRPVTPTVFLTVGDGFATCVRLEQGVRSGPLRRRIQYPYHPHVTLACEVADDILDKALADHAAFDARFAMASVTRYELGEEGVWQPARDFPLAPA